MTTHNDERAGIETYFTLPDAKSPAFSFRKSRDGRSVTGSNVNNSQNPNKLRDNVGPISNDSNCKVKR